MPKDTNHYLKIVDGEKYNKTIDMRCMQDPLGGAPSFVPYFDHLINPFPPCISFRKYIFITPRLQIYLV